MSETEKIRQLVVEIQAGESYLEQEEKKVKEFRKLHEQNKETLARHFQDAFIEDMTIDGKVVKAGFKPLYTIAGGKKSTPQRTEVIETLAGLGLIDESKIESFKEYNGNALNKSMKVLATTLPDKFKEMLDKKLVSVFNRPEVKIK